MGIFEQDAYVCSWRRETDQREVIMDVKIRERDRATAGCRTLELGKRRFYMGRYDENITTQGS